MWKTPKLNWMPGDGVKASDLNRIEENTDFLKRRIALSGGLENTVHRNPSNLATQDTWIAGTHYPVSGVIHLNEGEALYLLSYAVKKFGAYASTVTVPGVGAVDAPTAGSASGSFYDSPIEVTRIPGDYQYLVPSTISGTLSNPPSGVCTVTVELLVAPFDA